MELKTRKCDHIRTIFNDRKTLANDMIAYRRYENMVALFKSPKRLQKLNFGREKTSLI